MAGSLEKRLEADGVVIGEFLDHGSGITIGFSGYCDKLCHYLSEAYCPPDGRILICNRVSELDLGLDQAILCGLIINELVTNALKYAFPGHALASWSSLVESDSFIDRMAQGRTTLSKTDIVAVFQLAREVLGSLLGDGCYVKTPLGSAFPVAKGCLRTQNELFRPDIDGSGHELRIDFRLDPAIEAEALASIRCVRDKGGDRRQPVVKSVVAPPSESGDVVAPGGLLRIAGVHMKFDPGLKDLGLFLKSDSGCETRAEVYADIRPSLIVAVVPASLAEGDYRLIVRTKTEGGTPLEGSWTESLRIAAAE